jgi:DNA-nicking Smr family endonuclease
MRKLRRGQFIVGAELDLHGMTVPVAHRALNEFLARCLTTDTRCVRVIHGKGLSTPDRSPVLKSRVNNWLQQHGDVLAYCSARAHDGGTGAVYVLLKKHR